MLRAFLVVWTVVAGPAPAGLFFIARSGAPGSRSTPGPAVSGPGNTLSAPTSPVTPDVPSTGSIGASPTRSPTRNVRRVDEPPSAKPAGEARPVAPERQS